MQKQTKPMRPEYLYSALMCIGVALFIVILIIASSCNSSKPAETESSLPTSEVSEETSEPTPSKPTQFRTVSVKSDDVNAGPLACVKETATSIPEPTDLIGVYGKHTSYGLSGSALKLKNEALTALNRFSDAFKTAKGENTLILQKAYQPYPAEGASAIDAELASGYAMTFATYPVDKDNEDIGGGKYLWLTDNCYQYGFVLRFPSEKQQITGVSGNARLFRYVGYAHAAYMGKYHLCLEEYVEQIRLQFTAETPLRLTYADETSVEKICEIYYVAASEQEEIEIPIRGDEDVTYTVSGDGIGGFIVTCYLP